MSIQLRYPSITGRTTEERQQQMERAMRSMVDQLNMMMKKNESSAESESGGFEEMLNSKLGTTEKNFANQVKESWKTIYPVGAIYISASSTNPGTLFGGTWDQIKDRFLLAAGSTYSAGATGGEATHALTVNEMPSHNHTPANHNTAGSNTNYKRQFTTHLHTDSDSTGRIQVSKDNSSGYYAMTAKISGDIVGTSYTSDTGGGKAHNNMPPYLAVYVWKRTK